MYVMDTSLAERRHGNRTYWYAVIETLRVDNCHNVHLLFGQETAKGPFGLRVKLPPAHLSTTHGRGFTLALFNAELPAGKL